MKTVARIIGMVVVACAASALTSLALFLIMGLPLQRFDTVPLVYYGIGAVEAFARGFAFVFVGSLVVRRPQRAIAALCLVCVGIGVYLYDSTFYSSDGIALWHLGACIAGGLFGVSIQAWKGRKKGSQQDAAPNSRPPSQFPPSPEVQSSDSLRMSSSSGCG